MNSREIVERMLQAGLERDYATFVDLMAPDGHIEWPYHPSGAPVRVEGQEAIREFLRAADRVPIRFTEHRGLVIHETTDPAVVIVEYQAVGMVTGSGAPFEQRLIAVFTIHDGRIVSYRDYLDPMKLAAVLTPS
jgi:ketosteroid isomerase-like protein